MSNTTMRTYYTFDTDSVEFLVTEYAGSVERQYTRRDTTQRVHNTIGYYTDSTYYHYVKDHLGNVCAVVESAKDSLVQGTIYYPSGVPMSQSFGRDVQPYLYNGKEFVEAHGWNIYDYGFRGYYAPIGRFTSIDPLAEQTPWYSPYSYAGNRFVNSIDWMGLGGMTGFSSGYISTLNYIVIDLEGNMLGGVDDGDDTIYLDEDGVWSPEDGKKDLHPVGKMLWWRSHAWYMNRWHDAKSRGEDFRAPGLYSGQYSISQSVSIGIQISIPTQIGDLGITLVAYELIKKSDYMNGEYEYDYFGKEGAARITALQFELCGFGCQYSIKHELLGEMKYIPNSNTSSVSYGFLSVDKNGFFSITYSVGIGLAYTITISGNLYYGQNED